MHCQKRVVAKGVELAGLGELGQRVELEDVVVAR